MRGTWNVEQVASEGVWGRVEQVRGNGGWGR